MSLLLDLQEAIATRLAAAPELAGVAVLARRPKEPMDALAAAVASAELGLFVALPLPRQVRPNSTGLFAEDIEVRVTAFERPALNSTSQTAPGLVEAVLWLLHHWQPVGDDLAVGMLYAAAAPVAEASQPDEGLIAYDLTFSCAGGWSPR
jgi:hypothetical protein